MFASLKKSFVHWQTDRQTDRDRHRQTDRQTEIKTDTQALKGILTRYLPHLNESFVLLPNSMR